MLVRNLNPECAGAGFKLNDMENTIISALALLVGIAVLFKYVTYGNTVHKQDYQARREEFGYDERLERKHSTGMGGVSAGEEASAAKSEGP